jgi:hypothetical protein
LIYRDIITDRQDAVTLATFASRVLTRYEEVPVRPRTTLTTEECPPSSIGHRHYSDLHGIDKEELALVAEVGEKLLPMVEAIVADFYLWLPDLPDFKQFFPDDDPTSHIKAMQIS